MCVAVTIFNGVQRPCKQTSNGRLCFYHLEKIKKLRCQPTDGVDYIIAQDNGEVIYGEDAKRYWQEVSLGKVRTRNEA